MGQRRLDFEGLIKPAGGRIANGVLGEPMNNAPTADNLGFRAETPNGTAHAFSTGWNRDEPWSMPPLPPGPTRPGGRSNRSGE